MARPMSQILKESARKGKMPAEVGDTGLMAPTATKQTSASKKVALRVHAAAVGTPRVQAVVVSKSVPRIRTVQPKEMDVSITISVGSGDVPRELLGKMEEFLDKSCISGLCSIERGSSMNWLHLQMVCRLLASSAMMVSKKIKQHLEWDDPKKAPAGHHILTKVLRNTGLHTFIGMLGYCSKDKGEDHFECVHKNVTDAQLKEGMEEYIKHGTPFAKNRIVLTHTNLIERAATYCKYKMRKQLSSTLPGTILPMLQSGHYIPSASWVLPVRQGGMEYNRAASLWKCMINPGALEMSDVTQIFFEHTNPRSRLAELGRQQLATHLDEAREGALQEYNIEEPRSVVVLDQSQDDLAPMEDIVTEIAPAFIPVVFQNRDIANDLTL